MAAFTFPADSSAMPFLLGLDVGAGNTDRDGQLYTQVDGAGEQPVSAAAIDELESRGWIDCGGDSPKVTVSGAYWLNRWMQAKYGRKR